MSKVLISVLGEDRPGIIAAVTRILYRLDCNIENVSQTILQSEFGGLFIAAIPQNLMPEELHKHLQTELTPLNLSVHVKPIKSTSVERTIVESEPFVISIRGADRKGLVAGITEVIARYGVNVTNLQAVFKGGDDPDNNIMIYEVDVPIDINQQDLYRDLRERAAVLELDISIQHRNIFETLNRI